MAIYSVEEQQAVWLFASESEAKAFDNERADDHRWSRVSLFRGRPFRSANSNRPTEPGPGQERCRRIQRHCHKWGQAYEAWNKAAGYAKA